MPYRAHQEVEPGEFLWWIAVPDSHRIDTWNFDESGIALVEAANCASARQRVLDIFSVLFEFAGSGDAGQFCRVGNTRDN